MASYQLVKIRLHPEEKNDFTVEFFFGQESYSKYHSRLKKHFQIIEDAWNEETGDFDDYENLKVYGLSQAREHRKELILSGKYSAEEIIIEKTVTSYLFE